MFKVKDCEGNIHMVYAVNKDTWATFLLFDNINGWRWDYASHYTPCTANECEDYELIYPPGTGE